MNLPTTSIPTRLVFASLVILLAACSKQEPSTESFPVGNGGDALSAGECERIPDPPALDDSAASRSIAVSQGVALRAACKENARLQSDAGNSDLARIRAIKEKEDAQSTSSALSQKQYNNEAKDAASKPRIEIKY